MTPVESIEERAQRALDGMTINRDVFYRDVVKLCRAVKRLQAEVGRDPIAKDIFGDLFGGIWK